MGNQQDSPSNFRDRFSGGGQFNKQDIGGKGQGALGANASPGGNMLQQSSQSASNLNNGNMMHQFGNHAASVA